MLAEFLGLELKEEGPISEGVIDKSSSELKTYIFSSSSLVPVISNERLSRRYLIPLLLAPRARLGGKFIEHRKDQRRDLREVALGRPAV